MQALKKVEFRVVGISDPAIQDHLKELIGSIVRKAGSLSGGIAATICATYQWLKKKNMEALEMERRRIELVSESESAAWFYGRKMM